MADAASGAPADPCPFIFAITEGYKVVGAIQVGDNTSSGSDAGAILGGDTTGDTTSPVVWDDDPGDGFDSNWVSVQLVVDASSGNALASLTVIPQSGSAVTLNYDAGAASTIDTVEILGSSTGSGMTLSWQNVQVTYFTGDNASDSTTLSEECSPDADTSGPNAPPNESRASLLSPNSSGNTKVIVSALVRMQSSSGELPSPSAMVAQIFVFAH